jgi:formylglycine-generating enzyme required for sulfatase activity
MQKLHRSFLAAFAFGGALVACASAPVARAPHTAVAQPEEAPSATPTPSDCPDGMVLVEGEYCPNVMQRCLRWMDPKGKYHEYRCAEYAKPAICRGKREHRRFCIDRYERTGGVPADVPLNVQSWTDAKAACESQGARVCLESEWNFACEGEEMRPYAYGWSRQNAQCNADRMDLLVPGDESKLVDRRTPADAHPSCTSPFGVHGMAGNVAEWVSVDGFSDGRLVVQKGNWWQPGKHACRDAQGGHDKFYKGTETGFRCCKDAAP